jgi:hypothetical protein
MIKQIGPSTLFVSFTFIERLWDPFIKVSHTLLGSKLNLPHKIKKFTIYSYNRIDTNQHCHMCNILQS